jgi:hypothetical protein
VSNSTSASESFKSILVGVSFNGTSAGVSSGVS